jgi:hypothetical protein
MRIEDATVALNTQTAKEPKMCEEKYGRPAIKALTENSVGGDNMKKLIAEATNTVIEARRVPKFPPNLGLDLDGTISESPEYFKMLTSIWPGKIFIITYRRNFDEARNCVESFGITYDELILVDKMDGKAAVIAEKGVDVYYDDQPEMLHNVPENVQVFLVRNGGNFDFEDRLWIMSDRTAKLI